jgi:hypothetical protein
MIVVPVDMPVTMPVDEPTVATDGTLLSQLPPVREAVSVAVFPIHMPVGPEITGNSFTVIDRVTLQVPME